LASYPSYDPNLFSTGISSTDWISLFPENEEDPLAPRPLYNIAIQTAVQPGSTFKMVTALAALEKGLSPTKGIRDMGYVELGDYRPACWIWNQSKGTHGYENMYEAIRDSCNYYFYSVALGKNQRTGESLGMKVDIEDIVNLSKQLGLNDKTGIETNIPSEMSGGVPDPQRKIIITKNLLKKELNKKIQGYIKEDVKLTESEIKEVIDEIVSWTEMEEPLTRGEVIKRLNALGLEPEKRLPGDREGLADKIKYTYLNQAGWNISDTLNVTIGQGQSSYTPIQMANFISTLSNGGYRHDVTVVDSIKNFDNSKTIYEHKVNPERIQLNDYNNLEHVKLGMLKVSTEGTARKIFTNFPVKVATKTGTAEKSGINPSTGDTYDDFAWFVGFAPYDEPEIAIAAVIFQGGSGGYAGPLAREIIAEYLGLNADETKETLPFESELAR
jgi:penicillin-binding protein 2